MKKHQVVRFDNHKEVLFEGSLEECMKFDLEYGSEITQIITLTLHPPNDPNDNRMLYKIPMNVG